MMKYIFIYTALFFGVVFILSRYVICKERWSDRRAYRAFRNRDVSLKIVDQWIDGYRLHYAVTGDEDLPILVFIHGSPGSWYSFRMFMWDRDLLRKFRMISIDRPGFGYSNFGQAMHLQDQTKLILDLLRQLKKEQPLFLFGHSYGGPVVASLAADDPGLFKTVFIVAGAIDPELEKKEIWRLIIAGRPLFWFIPGAYQPSNTELLLLKKDLELLANDLARITCSLPLVHGDKDGVVPPGNVAYGQKIMLNAASTTVDILKGAGHGLHRERTKEIKEILLGLE
jgi:pimeloyl-ACP methyl ester carboxylesterase